MDRPHDNENIQGSNTPTVPPSAGISSAFIDPQSFKVYKPPSSSGTLPTDELTDADFEPTTAQLQVAYAQSKAKLDAIVNAPLTTRAIKAKDEKSRQTRWPTTTLRIRFPNQLIIERSFDSTDKIKDIYRFVRGALTQEALNDKFILYQAPKRELKVSDPSVKTLSLAELGLAPSSILLVRFQSEAYNSTTLPPPILPQLLDQAVVLPGTSEAEETVQERPQTASSLTPNVSAPASGEKKVPKWFKMGPNAKK